MSKAHWLALCSVQGIGGTTARRLAERFGGIEGVFSASEEELALVPRITPEMAVAILEAPIEDMEAGVLSLADNGIEVVTWDDDEYPESLRDVSDAPPYLYIYGSVLPEDRQAAAVIGTREPSPDSAEVAETIACRLAERGLTIVSGLAIGIDTAAHKGALQADGGRTIGVLGSGLRMIHPRQNVELAEEMAARGAVISELRPDTPPSGPNLMARDRLISGLSRAVIVIEAGLKSGSMDTAARAKKQGRLVYAVPGSPGTDSLIAGGAEALDPAALDFDELADAITGHTAGGSQLNLWG